MAKWEQTSTFVMHGTARNPKSITDLCRLDLTIGFKRDNPEPAPSAETMATVDRNLAARVNNRPAVAANVAKLRKLAATATDLREKIAGIDQQLAALDERRKVAAGNIDADLVAELQTLSAERKPLDAERADFTDALKTTQDAITALIPAVQAAIDKAAEDSARECSGGLTAQGQDISARIATKVSDDLETLVMLRRAADIAGKSASGAARRLMETFGVSGLTSHLT